MTIRPPLAVLLLCAVAVAVLPAAAGAAPVPAAPGCAIFPADNPWNQRVDSLPVAQGSPALMASMGIAHLHADWSDADGAGYGIPFQVVDRSTPRRAVRFDYADESDPGPYPIPNNPLIEGGSDRHLITLDKTTCTLRELFAARRTATGAWRAGSGAVFDLDSNRLRPAGWTSADAAGLPILPGLARWPEVAAGRIDHALRFTLPVTQRAYTWPARHYASSQTEPTLAPMGIRIRLKKAFDISGFGPQARVVLRAAKEYGLILADNGSAGYISGAPARGWNDDDLHDLHDVPGSAFEVVDTSSLPRAHGARLWNPRYSVAGDVAVARLFVTAATPLVFQAIRGGEVIAQRRVSARHGFVRVTMRARPNATYRVRRDG